MGTRRKLSAATPPRQIGDIQVTEAVIKRRKISKRPESTEQGQLFPAINLGSPPAHVQPLASVPPSLANTEGKLGESRSADEVGERAPLFQSSGHCSDKKVLCPQDLGTVVDQQWRLRPCKCRKWFCEQCGPILGYKLRQRLLLRLRGFNHVFGITFTVDGSLFSSPEASWQYVMGQHLLSRFVRELSRRKLLDAKHYFWVVEFQAKTDFHKQRPPV